MNFWLLNFHIFCIISFWSSAQQRLEYCKAEFSDSYFLAVLNLQPYENSKLSWNAMSKHLFYYFVVSSESNFIYLVPRNLTIHRWHDDCDYKMWAKINQYESLPTLILPLNSGDESFSKASVVETVPYLSYCTLNENHIDILFPKGYYGKCRPNPNIHRISNYSEWLEKENKLWFRGTLNHGARKGRLTIINETIK